MSYDPKRQRYLCFSCKEKGDIFDLMKHLEPDEAPDFVGAYQLAKERYQGKPADEPDPPAQGVEPTESNWQRQFDLEWSCPAWQNKEGRAYLQARGLTGETAQQFDLKHDSDKGRSALIFPYGDQEGYFYNSRSLHPDAEPRYYKHGKQTRIFNQDALYTHGQGHVFITEGEIDAMSITQAGGQAVALGSTTGLGVFVKTLAEKATQKHLILAFDPDEAGRRTTAEASKALDSMGIRYSIYHMGGAYHDANDLLTKGGQEALTNEVHKAIEHAQKAPETPTQNTDTQPATSQDTSNTQEQQRKASPLTIPTPDNPQPDNIQDYLANDFDKENKVYQQYEGLKTLIPALDRAMDDYIFPDLYIVGAVPGLGKTTLMLQLAANFAKQGRHILFFSMEQSKQVLTSKGISREAKLQDIHGDPPTAKQIRRGKTTPAVKKGWEEYQKYSKRLNIIGCNFGVTMQDILQYIEGYMAVNNVKPVVFIDYLQALAAGKGSTAGYRASVDQNMIGLKSFQEANGLIVFLVSSFNRENYGVTADYTSFKESGGIDYTGSVIWAMELSILGEEKYRNTTGLKQGVKLDKDAITAEKRKMRELAAGELTRSIIIKCIKNKDGDPFNDCELVFHKKNDLFTGD